MLTKIKILGAASFESEASLETTKKVNLIYGLNGSGKSTICRYLAKSAASEFSRCSKELSEDCEIVVFNDDFIKSNFYEAENIPGIFSLSKRNKDAEQRLSALTEERALLCEKHAEAKRLINERKETLTATREKILDGLFEIKRKYSGGDRILEFCLEGLIGSKERLATYLLNTAKPDQEPPSSIKDLQNEVRLLQHSKNNPPQSLLPIFSICSAVEEHGLLQTSIVGAENSTFAEFINSLKNSDWVKEGAEKYLGADSNFPKSCPFCQQATISQDFLKSLSTYFDATYELQISQLKELKDQYGSSIQKFPSLDVLKRSIFYTEEIAVAHSKIIEITSSNLGTLSEKVANPSEPIRLRASSEALTELNKLIEDCNAKTESHNLKLQNISSELSRIKSEFWQIMRWQYDSTVGVLAATNSDYDQANTLASDGEVEFTAQLKSLDGEIANNRKDVVNTDDAVEKINIELLNMGVSDFSIKKHDLSEHRYELVRKNAVSDSFRSLSEGEKMVISLLYFCELCTGSHQPASSSKKRVVVLDDPISSLSHIHVFNVGRLLWSHFFRNQRIAQVFVFTHSLYFFYELVDSNKDQRKATQELFRVSKTSNGSTVQQLHYEELQNDYHTYWSIVNNKTAEPALLANCMRNIVEYFFGFVEKTSFANVFQKPALQAPHFQAFNRYMNRESHSFGQNVFDLKEFDYDIFRNGLELIFQETGYSKHYEQMSKV